MSIRIPTVLLLFVSFACAPPQTSDTSQDSTASAATGDTVQSTMVAETSPEEASQSESPSDTSMLESRYAAVNQAVVDSADSYFHVTISTSQYEAGSDVTWYFDDSFSPRYFKETWSMEGTEGSTEYFIEDNKVVCVSIDESYGSGSTSTQWCDKTGGIMSTWRDGVDGPEKVMVAADFAKTHKDELARYLDILKRLLNEGKITEESDNTLTVRLENTVNVGFETTESGEVHIARALYDQLN